MRVELPGDQWADLRDPDSLTGEDEMKVRSALKLTAARDEENGGDAQSFGTTAGGSVAMEFAMLARVITSWSRPEAITADSIRALPLKVLRPLRKAIEPHMLELREDQDPNSPAGS